MKGQADETRQDEIIRTLATAHPKEANYERVRDELAALTARSQSRAAAALVCATRWLAGATLLLAVFTAFLAVPAIRDVIGGGAHGNWVLWEDTLSASAGISTEPIRAYPTKDTCDRGLREALASYVSVPGATVRTDEKRQEVYVTIGQSTTGYRFVCLPETIDPRGPKGK